MLKLFEVIEDCAKIHRESKLLYEKAHKEIEKVLIDNLNFFEGLKVVSRIKAEESLKEKILRKSLIKPEFTPQDVLDQMPDKLGILVLCKFVSEESEIFKHLSSSFVKDENSNFYSYDKNLNLKLDLSEVQPLKQQNGNTLYRIDGKIKINGQKILFELQIKSLVNKFWSDIEHSLVYKNNVYIPNNNYPVRMINSVRNNLFEIDKMLEIIKEQIEFLSIPVSESMSVETLLSKLINDSLCEEMNESLGFVVKSTLVSNNLMKFCLFLAGTEENYMLVFSKVAMELERLKNEDIDFKSEIFFETKSSRLRELLKESECDFNIHLFFVYYLELFGKDEEAFKRLESYVETFSMNENSEQFIHI